MPSPRQCAATFALALGWELLNALYVLSVAERHLEWVVAIGLVQPFVGLLSALWWIEQPTRRGRVVLTAAGAVGYAVGGAVALWWWR